MNLAVSTGARFSAILGIGGYRPRRIVDNAEICTYIDSSDEWIRTRSGIIERRWASADETVQMMSSPPLAARWSVLRSSRPRSTPSSFPQSPTSTNTSRGDHDRSELGATGAAAFDISAACAGFCYATAMADFVRTGASKYVLVVGVERLSDMTNKYDRSTAFSSLTVRARR